MPKTNISTPQISIDIPDAEYGDTVIKRKAVLFNMNYNQSVKQLVLQWQVKHFADVNGTAGDPITLIPDWTKETIADNTTMCNAANGYPMEPLAAGDPNADENGYPKDMNYMGQYDFFYALAAQQPITVHPLIIQFGQLVQSWEKP